MKKALKWIPRILAILCIGFISMFALDVFSEGYGFPEVLVALFMHLIPSLLLLTALIVAWERPRIGGAIFLVLALVTIFFFNVTENPVALLVTTLPLGVIGSLFLIRNQ
jgi:hypothetical protein